MAKLWHRIVLEVQHNALRAGGSRPPDGGQSLPAFDKRVATGTADYGAERRFRTRRRGLPRKVGK
jgi:hypothetical protein